MPQPPESEPRDGRLALGFACVGHGLMHLFAAFYFVIVLELERVWGLPYAEALTLWTPGAALIALGAIPAGWLADRWSTPGMMVVMFIGMGLAAVVCGLATTPLVMGLGLVALGLFCAIYHPVGIPWIVRIARRPGQALGVNGIFGSIGVAGAGLITGWLIDVQGWRAAFVVPGLVSLGLGFALGWCWWRGWVADCPAHPRQHQEPSRGEQWRALGILIVTMSCLGLAFQAMQAALPKVFSLRFSDAWQLDVAGAGYLVGAVYVVAGVTQLVGGMLADRLPPKGLYVAGLWLQVPMLIAVAHGQGGWLLAAATGAIFLNAAVLPAENLLLRRYTPDRYRSLAFGVKFALAFGVGPLGVLLVSATVAQTGELVVLYWALAIAVAIAWGMAALLPRGSATPAVAPVAGR